jgi:hypothetical protein
VPGVTTSSCFTVRMALYCTDEYFASVFYCYGPYPFRGNRRRNRLKWKHGLQEDHLLKHVDLLAIAIFGFSCPIRRRKFLSATSAVLSHFASRLPRWLSYNELLPMFTRDFTYSFRIIEHHCSLTRCQVWIFGDCDYLQFFRLTNNI